MTKQLIQLIGRAQHGKDTIADILVSDYGFKKFSYAAALKRGVAAMLDLGDNPDWETLKTTKVPGFDFTYGRVLQVMGTEGGRTIDPMFWVKLLYNSKSFQEAEKAVIVDGRFASEIQAAYDIGAQLWYVERPGYTAPGRDPNHPSEKIQFPDGISLDEYNVILNDKGYDDYVRTVKNTCNVYLGEPLTAVDKEAIEEARRAEQNPDDGFKFEVGQRVKKVGGSYEATGTIRARFWTRYAQERYVMDFDTPEGLLHIFGANNLEAE